jgi:ferric-dicitrate binding protein FerR (iron transport regulator)
MNFIHIPDNQQIAGLFLKHHMQDTTEEEEKILLDWANESQENRACYNRFMDEDWVFSQLAQFDKPDIELAIHNVEQKIAKQRTRRRILIIKTVSVAAAIIMAVFILWKEKATFNETPTVAKRTIKAPANAPFGKALLVIEDEELIDLDTVKDGLIGKFGDLRIEKAKQVIRYKSMGNSPTGGSVYTKLLTGQACQYQVILPDNSAVDLSASSWLRQGIVPNAQERRVEFAGRAFFDVTHDKKPFFVTVGKAEVQVMGTQFNVYAYDRDGVFKTALVNGHVKIKSGDFKADLFPGQTATIIPGQPITKQEGSIEKEVGWKKGEFVFDHDNITTVMRELSRWYDIEVKYIGPPPTGSITSRIARTPELDKVLNMLNELHTVSLKRDPVNKKLVTVSAWKD